VHQAIWEQNVCTKGNIVVSKSEEDQIEKAHLYSEPCSRSGHQAVLIFCVFVFSLTCIFCVRLFSSFTLRYIHSSFFCGQNMRSHSKTERQVNTMKLAMKTPNGDNLSDVGETSLSMRLQKCSRCVTPIFKVVGKQFARIDCQITTLDDVRVLYLANVDQPTVDSGEGTPNSHQRMRTKYSILQPTTRTNREKDRLSEPLSISRALERDLTKILEKKYTGRPWPKNGRHVCTESLLYHMTSWRTT
jgi:hypothetical protein